MLWRINRGISMLSGPPVQAESGWRRARMAWQ
jgi:hypothetical protein